MPELTLVTPIYNEAANLPALYERLCATLEPLKLDWEWIAVDDHSADTGFQLLSDLARRDPRVRALRLARNSGSHAAIACGLHHSRGACAVVLAADLQDPPEIIPQLLEPWRQGAQVVWAARERRVGAGLGTRVFARLYYFLMRRVIGIRQMPATGADCFLLDQRVVEALRQCRESPVSLLALITWMGFRQITVPYDKQARLHGRSGWSLGRKVKLVIDSVTAFSYLPIRCMSFLGILVALLGFLYAGVVVVHAVIGKPTTGWASLMVVVLVLGGVQMLMLGMLGEYVWRTLEEARRRPRYLIEADTRLRPGASPTDVPEAAERRPGG